MTVLNKTDRILARRKSVAGSALLPPIVAPGTYATENIRGLTLSRDYLPWMAMLLSIIIWIQPGASETSSLGNTGNIYRMFLVIAAGIATPILLFRNLDRLGSVLFLPIILLFLYGLMAFLSSILVPSNSFYTMWKSLEILVDVMAILIILASTQRPYESAILAYRMLIAISTGIILCVAAGAIISPADAFRGSRGIIPVMLQGWFPIINPNSLGFISVLVLIHNIAIFGQNSEKWRRVAAIVICLITATTLILAQSRTATVSFVLGLAVYLFLDKKRLHAAMLFGGAALLFAFTSAKELFMGYLQRGQSEELMLSLSGRTHGWTAAWELFQQSPYIGHGFAAAARTEILGGGNASTLHGALFDVIVGVGLAGLAPWLLAILLTLFALLKLTLKMHRSSAPKQMRSIHAELCAIAVILVIRASTSSGLAMHDYSLMILLCLAGYAYSMNKIKPYRST